MKLQKNKDLSSLTTMQAGGVAKYYCEVSDKEELQKVFQFALKEGIDVLVIGGGSNIYFSDKILDKLILRLINDDLEIIEETKRNSLIKVGAGHVWDNFVNKAIKLQLQGIECLSGIPGTVGAAPIQNIGAYGQEFENVFVSLTAFDKKNKQFVELNKKECNFGYRDSIFKHSDSNNRYIIFDVTVKLYKGKKPFTGYDLLRTYLEEEKRIKRPTLIQVREAVLYIRNSKLEDYNKLPNAGSFFKNPIVNKKKKDKLKSKHPNIPVFNVGGGDYKISAGWLIEKSGWKGKKFNNVSVSNKHALVIVNPKGKGTSDDIDNLSSLIIKDVKNKYGITIEPEVRKIY